MRDIITFILARFSARLHARSRYRARVGTRKYQSSKNRLTKNSSLRVRHQIQCHDEQSEINHQSIATTQIEFVL